jgi:large subunit ribosomal protein L25
METISLAATGRSITGKAVKTLRKAGKLPVVVYGHGVEPRNIEVDTRQFEKVLEAAGESTLIDLNIDGKDAVKVLIQDTQREPLLSRLMHADLRQIDMNENIEVQVALQFVGESPAVKALGAILVKNMDEVTVRCLPKDLVHEINVDITSLTQFHDSIAIKDLKLPAGLEVIGNPNDLIIVANEPISEAELAALDSAVTVDVSAVKVETEEKKKAKEEAAKADKE